MAGPRLGINRRRQETRLARLFVIIGGLLVLMLTAALVGPYFIDWTSYRADFEREASIILGRDVKVNGDARARLLPFPSVTFTDVSVAGNDPAMPAMTAEQFSMDLELAPFMRGEVLIFDMRLVRPDIAMSISDSGAIDWAIRPEAYFDASRVSLEKLTVVEGRLRLRHGPSGRQHLLTEINTDISARALTGPWRIDGSMRVDGMRHAVNVSTGAVGADGAMRLRLRAAPERYPLSLEADGGLSAAADGIRYRGTFAVAIGRQEQPEAAGQRPRPPVPAYRLRGNFDVDHRRLDIGEFRLETGPAEDPYTADGTAFVDFGAEPRFSVKADGAQLRLEDGPAVEGEASGLALKERLSAVREFLRDLPLPGMPGSVEVNLPALVAGDTTLRDIRLNAMPVDGGWRLDALHASLPGRTTLEGKGLLTVEDALAFRGSLLLAVGQPSGFAGWLSSDINDAIRRLPAAGFSAEVDLSETAQRFSDLELILGGARFKGSVERDTPAGARPSLRVELDGQGLDVDGMMAFAALFFGQDGYRRLVHEDIDLALRAGPVAGFGLSAESIDTALRLREEAVEIDRLMVGGLEGAAISATGTLRQLGSAPAGNIDADLVSVDLRPLLAALAQQFPGNRLIAGLAERGRAYPELFTDAKLGMVMTAAPDGAGSGLAVSAHGGTEALDFTLTLSGAGLGMTDRPMEFAAEASSADAAALYALYGLPSLPMGLAGAAATEVAFRGVLSQGGSASMAFKGEGLALSFTGDMTLAGGVPSLAGRASIEAEDLEPWLMTAAVGFPGLGLGLPVSLGARIDHGPDLTVISELSGEIAGSALSGDLNMSMVNGLPSLTGEVDVASLDLRPAVEMVLGADALDAVDDGWPRAVFRPRAEPPVGLDLSLSTRQFTFADGWQAEEVTGRFSLGQSGMRLSDMAGKALGGRVGGLVELGNNEGSGFLSAQLRLEDIALEQLMPEAGLSAKADAGVSVTTTGKTVDAMVASLAGSGTVTYRDLRIAGINPDPFAALVSEADGIGRDIDADAVARFAPGLLRTGILEAGSGEAAFSIANGVMRAPPLRIETEKAVTTADLRLDLGKRSVSADATVEYDAGEEQLVGSTPTVRYSASGPIDAPVVGLDTAPLAQFLTQRALEIEQRRVEAMQAALLEGQRLRREVRYYAALEDARNAAEQERLRQEEEREQLRQRLRDHLQQQERERVEQQRRAEEESGRRAAEEARRQAAEQARHAPQVPSPQALPIPSDPPAAAPAPLPSDRPGNPFQMGPSGDNTGAFSPDAFRLNNPGAGQTQ